MERTALKLRALQVGTFGTEVTTRLDVQQAQSARQVAQAHRKIPVEALHHPTAIGQLTDPQLQPRWPAPLPRSGLLRWRHTNAASTQ